MKGNFDSVIQDARPVVVDFHALWCSPCKMQSPILKEVAAELGDKVRHREYTELHRGAPMLTLWTSVIPLWLMRMGNVR